MDNYLINYFGINKYENKKEEKKILYNKFENKSHKKRLKSIKDKKHKTDCSISLISLAFKTIVFGIIYFILLKTIKVNNYEKNTETKKITNKIISNFNNSRKYKILSNNEALEIGKKYMEICQKGILINNQKFIESSQPKISVIIPTYNSEKTIKATIRSIQNQNMTDIEIISVNDFSTDNCTKIVEEMQMTDPRIKIIHNSKRMGVLYTRSIGVLNARGKYITTIDNDDLFANADLFDVIYEETENEYYDIISFKGFGNLGYKGFQEFCNTVKKDKNNPIVLQPDLGIFAINPKDPLFQNNILIWGKLIRTNIYKEAINNLGKERYSYTVNWAEDTSMFFVICKVAKSYKFIDFFGIFHIFSRKSASSLLYKNDNVFGTIFLCDLLFDFSRNQYKNSSVHMLKDLRKRDFFNLSEERSINYLRKVIQKVLNSEYIDEKSKNEIRESYKGFNVF